MGKFYTRQRCKPTSTGQILTEPLFDNRFLPTVKSRGKQLTFLSDWCRAEITEIQDLTYGVIPKLLPCEAVKELLSKPTAQTKKQHAMVLNSITPDGLQVLKTEIAKPDENFSIKISPDTKLKLVTQLTCRWLYDTLLLDKARSTDHSYRQSWGTTLGHINWKKTFKNIQKNNFDRKANDLCWKILHRCLPTAKRLAGRSPFFPSSTCQVCEKHEENQTHLLFLCPSAKKIWKHITNLIRPRFPTYANYSVTFKDVLCDFQDIDELRNSFVARFLRDIGLRHIWQHRNAVVYNDQNPDTLCIFKAKIKQKVKTEFHIAKLSGKLENFQRDWTHHNLLTEIRNGVLILNF